jgi:hypothetical protein
MCELCTLGALGLAGVVAKVVAARRRDKEGGKLDQKTGLESPLSPAAIEQAVTKPELRVPPG